MPGSDGSNSSDGSDSSDAVPAFVAGLTAALVAEADPVRGAAQQRYMKSELPFLGLSVPRVRALVGAAVRAAPLPTVTHWRRAVAALWDDPPYREYRYAALGVVRHRRHGRFLTVSELPLLEHLVVTGAWWDLVDETASVVGGLRVREPALTDPLRVWAAAPDLWRRRVAIICQVGHGADIDLGLLTTAIEHNLEGTPTAAPDGRQDFFIRKAIGWALRDYSRTDPHWVRGFVHDHRDRLSGLTVREALKNLPAAEKA